MVQSTEVTLVEEGGTDFYNAHSSEAGSAAASAYAKGGEYGS